MPDSGSRRIRTAGSDGAPRPLEEVGAVAHDDTDDAEIHVRTEAPIEANFLDAVSDPSLDR